MEALSKAAQMVDEMEETYKDKIDILGMTVDDLGTKIDELLAEKEDLKVEVQDARRVFTGLQFSVSILLFAYGLFYGLYFGKCT